MHLIRSALLCALVLGANACSAQVDGPANELADQLGKDEAEVPAVSTPPAEATVPVAPVEGGPGSSKPDADKVDSAGSDQGPPPEKTDVGSKGETPADAPGVDKPNPPANDGYADCANAVKAAVLAGELPIEKYESTLYEKCGGNAPEAPAEPTPQPSYSPEYIECANAVKAKVNSGSLPLSLYEETLTATCSVYQPTPSKE